MTINYGKPCVVLLYGIFNDLIVAVLCSRRQSQESPREFPWQIVTWFLTANPMILMSVIPQS